MAYVKLHGALYHRAATDEHLAGEVAQALGELGVRAMLAPPGSLLVSAGAAVGMAVATEGFCDRAYRADGQLADRATPGAVLTDPGIAAAQALAIALGRPVVAADGTLVRVEASSLCVHGDTPGAVGHARHVRSVLTRAGVLVAPFVEHEA